MKRHVEQQQSLLEPLIYFLPIAGFYYCFQDSTTDAPPTAGGLKAGFLGSQSAVAKSETRVAEKKASPNKGASRKGKGKVVDDMDPASWAQRLAEAADVDALERESGDRVDMEAAAAAEKERVRKK